MASKTTFGENGLINVIHETLFSKVLLASKYSRYFKRMFD